MRKKIEKEEFIGVLVLVVLTIILTFRCWKTEKNIKENKVYVLGYLIKSAFGGSENGWMYDFEYRYDNKKFIRSFSGPIKSYILSDSLIFIEISSKHPYLSRQLESIRVPKCLKFNSTPRYGWKEMPSCQ